MNLLQSLIPRLKVSEGWREHVYVDTTSNLTIGYGHNLAHIEVFPARPEQTPGTKVYKVMGGYVRLSPVNGIPKHVGETLLIGDVGEVTSRLSEHLPWYQQMDEVRREVLTELCFNIGISVLQYRVFMRQLQVKDYRGAADNMRGWKWRKKVGDGRALPLIRMMEMGVRV